MILILNPGSSSLKYKLFNSSFEVLKEGDFNYTEKETAVERVLDQVSYFWDKIDKVGIRVVLAGKKKKSEIIGASIINQIKKHSHLAPLHNPRSLEAYLSVRKIDDTIKIFAVFDNSLYFDLPACQKEYPLPAKIVKDLGIIKYGFHGISHKNAAEKVDPKRQYKIVTIHLGSGCSITAFKKGQVIDTSMGMTPLEGLVMQTRPGDVDSGIVLLMVKKYGLTKAKKMLENQSGLAGITGSTGDMKDVLYSAGYKISNTNLKKFKKVKNASLALDIYVNRIKKYIGGYAALMGGIDKIAFSGEIGYRSPIIRNMVMDGLEFLKISTIKVIKPEEELEMAKEIQNEA